MEGISKKVADRMRQGPPTKTPEARPEYLSATLTIDEIVQTKDKQFDAFLESIGSPKGTQEVMARYLEGVATAGDLDKLMGYAEQFNVRTERAERLAHAFNDYYGEMTGRSLELKRLATNIGSEKLQTITSKGLVELSYKDPKAFAALEAHFKQLEKTDDEERALDKSIGEFCGKHNLHADSLEEAIAHTDLNERARAIRVLMQHHMTGWQRIKDSIKNVTVQGGSRSESLGMASRLREITDLDARKQAFLTDAGSSLALLLKKNDDLRHALATIQSGTEPVISKGIESRMSLDDARTIQFKPAELESYARNFIESRMGSWKNWTELAPDQRERTMDTIWNGFEKEQFKEKPDGYFARLMRFLFGKHKDTAKSILKDLKEKES